MIVKNDMFDNDVNKSRHKWYDSVITGSAKAYNGERHYTISLYDLDNSYNGGSQCNLIAVYTNLSPEKLVVLALRVPNSITY